MKTSISSLRNLVSQVADTYKKVVKWLIAPFFMIVVTFLTYWPSLRNPFMFDDGPAILKFYNIRNLTIKELFLRSSRWISFWLNTIFYSYSKFDPFIYRAFNLAIHLVSGLVIFYILMLILPRAKNSFLRINSFYISLISAILFLLHPVQTQTISYVVQGQLEGLSALFILITTLAFVLYALIENAFFKYFILSFVFGFGFISTGTKEIAIISPAILFLVDWFFISCGDIKLLRQRIPFYVAYSVVVFGSYVYLMKPSFFYNIFGLSHIAKNNVGNILTQRPDQIITPSVFLISQFKVILHYVWIFVWPFGISVDYDWKLVGSIYDLDCWLPMLAVIAAVIYLLISLFKNRLTLFTFALCWFLIGILPRSSFIPSSELMADYKTYFASVGILVLIASLLVKFFYWASEKSNFSRNFVFFINLSLLTLLLSFFSYKRNLVWSNGEIFWTDIIKKAPMKARGYNNYAIELIHQKKFNDAIPYLKKAIALEPYTYPDPYTNLANLYAIIGDMDMAISTLKRSLQINQYQPDAYNSLGVFLMEKKDFETAKRSFASAISLIPHFGKPYYNLARIYKVEGDLENAYKVLMQACYKTDLDNDVLVWEPLFDVCMALMKFDEALNAANKLCSINPSAQYLFRLGSAYYMLKDYFKAADIFEKVILKEPLSIKSYCNLIDCYIKTERLDFASIKLKELHAKRISYPGIEIHEAHVLIYLGEKQLASDLLKDFLKRKDLPHEVAIMAQKLLKSI